MVMYVRRKMHRDVEMVASVRTKVNGMNGLIFEVSLYRGVFSPLRKPSLLSSS